MNPVIGKVMSVGRVFASVFIEDPCSCGNIGNLCEVNHSRLIRVPIERGLYVRDGLNGPEFSKEKPEWAAPLRAPLIGNKIAIDCDSFGNAISWVYFIEVEKSLQRIMRRNGQPAFVQIISKAQPQQLAASAA